MGEVMVSMDEYQEQVVSEVIDVLWELDRDDLVRELDRVVDEWDRKRKELLRTIDILEGVINNEK